jgi:hypothetical protein
VGFKWAIPVIAQNNSYNWDYFITYTVTHIVKGHNCRVNKQQDVERFSLGKAVWKAVYRRV